ncbi:hypothetical protein AB0L04_00785 [Streptomyces glaucescens]|uniref:hypothetical protein n=1 Tax=Streptomyces glaucescens TaxID=1907 RepID=UPI00344F6A92
MTVDLSRLDVPLPVVEADACFLAAAARATDPKDRLVYLLDAKLLHPTAPLATDDDYPGFAEWVAAREADNRRARKDRKQVAA